MVAGGSGSQQDAWPTLAEGALQLPALTRLLSLKGLQIELGEKGVDEGPTWPGQRVSTDDGLPPG